MRVAPEKLADIYQASGDRGSRGHGGTHQVSAASPSLSAFEIAIGCGCTSLTGLEDILVHAETHRATWVAPLEPRVGENLMQPFSFRCRFDGVRARHNHRTYAARDLPTPDHCCCFTEVLDASVGTGAEKHAVDRQPLERQSRMETHVVERTLEDSRSATDRRRRDQEPARRSPPSLRDWFPR